MLTTPNLNLRFDTLSGASPLHDANGNLTNDGLSQTYSYDPENRDYGDSAPNSPPSPPPNKLFPTANQMG